jgi:hypothetical protein
MLPDRVREVLAPYCISEPFGPNDLQFISAVKRGLNELVEVACCLRVGIKLLRFYVVKFAVIIDVFTNADSVWFHGCVV